MSSSTLDASQIDLRMTLAKQNKIENESSYRSVRSRFRNHAGLDENSNFRSEVNCFCNKKYS